MNTEQLYRMRPLPVNSWLLAGIPRLQVDRLTSAAISAAPREPPGCARSFPSPSDSKRCNHLLRSAAMKKCSGSGDTADRVPCSGMLRSATLKKCSGSNDAAVHGPCRGIQRSATPRRGTRPGDTARRGGRNRIPQSATPENDFRARRTLPSAGVASETLRNGVERSGNDTSPNSRAFNGFGDDAELPVPHTRFRRRRRLPTRATKQNGMKCVHSIRFH